jgi:DNA-binding GntR family transcriptional regulator
VAGTRPKTPTLNAREHESYVAFDFYGSRSLTPVGKDTLSDRVYDQLARALMTGEFEPGSSITLRTLAEHVGTSVMPVRDAVRHLVAQHALILERNKAIRIPLLSDSEFNQLWHLRELLEGEACAQAALVIPAAELSVLLALLTESLKAARIGDMRPIITNSHEFLFRIYRATRNSVLVSMIEMLWLQTGPLYFEAVSTANHLAFVRKSLKNNAALFETLQARDAVAARTTRERDLRQLAAWLTNHRECAELPIKLSAALAIETTKASTRQWRDRRRRGS